MKLYFYRPQRSWGKVIFSQASVILSAGGVPGPGGCAWSGGVPGPGGMVPGGNPPGRLLLRAVRILLECILVSSFVRWEWVTAIPWRVQVLQQYEP